MPYTSHARKQTRHTCVRAAQQTGQLLETELFTLMSSMVEISVKRLVSHRMFVKLFVCPSVVKLVFERDGFPSLGSRESTSTQQERTSARLAFP